MKGRKPKPTQLKIIAGNPGGRPMNEDEPIPEGDLYDAPEWMSAGQKESWAYAIEHAPEGLLKKLDRAAFTSFIIAEDRHRRAEIMVEQEGMTLVSVRGNAMPHPMLSEARLQAQIMLKAAGEIGFTPSSRSRVKVSGADKNKNRFAQNGKKRA